MKFHSCILVVFFSLAIPVFTTTTTTTNTNTTTTTTTTQNCDCISECSQESCESPFCSCCPQCLCQPKCDESLICRNNTCILPTSNTNECQNGNATFKLGEFYYSPDCNTECLCEKGGNFLCHANECAQGLVRRGSFDNDPSCFQADDTDKSCCVLMICPSEAEYEEYEDGEARFASEDNLKFLQITSTTIQVEFPSISGGNLMYVEDKLYRGLGEENRHRGKIDDTPWENAIILEGNKIFTLTGLKDGTSYRLRWQSPNKQYSDIVVATQDYNKKSPKVIVTSKDFDSVTLSFDHFASPSYSHGYVAQYKEMDEEIWSLWTEEGVKDSNSGVPFIRIQKLKPNTKYVAKISVYEDALARILGKSTSEIQFMTEHGCVHNGTSVALGLFYVECESTCNCSQNGTVSCGDRCVPPLYRSGLQEQDSLCVEQVVENNECCVLRTCAGNEKGPCTEITCGQNAECRHEVFRGEEADTICVCKEGFNGDPDSSKGCSKIPTSSLASETSCVVKNETYLMGQYWFEGCDYKCHCSSSLEIFCQPRCKELPKGYNMSVCELRADSKDSCCQILYCPNPSSENDLKPVALPFDGCLFKNMSYETEERFYDGCEQQCQCMGFGDMVCVSRCPPTAPAPGQNCITLPDASDSCCNITVCDEPVFNPDDNVKKESFAFSKEPRIVNVEEASLYIPQTNIVGELIGQLSSYSNNVTGSVYALNDSTLYIKNFNYQGSNGRAYFTGGTTGTPSDSPRFLIPYPSEENDTPLKNLTNQNLLLTLPSNVSSVSLRWLSIWNKDNQSNLGDLIWPKQSSLTKDVGSKNGCTFQERTYEYGDVFHDECKQFCICTQERDVECNPIVCPTEFGLDVINPYCLHWNKHENFVPSVPMCCPPLPVCLSDGSCVYKNQTFPNYANIPMNLTGCEHRCYCENSTVECQNACHPVVDTPPSYLSCDSRRAIIKAKEDRNCCQTWACSLLDDLPNSLDSVDFTSFNSTAMITKLVVPSYLSGHVGFFEVLLGTEADESPEEWTKQIIHPKRKAFDVSSDDTLEFVLSELLPDKRYFARVNIHVLDEIGGEKIISSRILTLVTSKEKESKVPDLELKTIQVNLTVDKITFQSAFVSWKFFSAEEKKFIDGVQIRYSKVGIVSGVPFTTPFIHRDTNFFLLDSLEPNTKYEVQLFIIPFPETETELLAEPKIRFATQNFSDPYDFTIKLNVDDVGSEWIRVVWSGIPEPHQKYINIYRLLYVDESLNTINSESIFKISKIQVDPIMSIVHLKPDTKYQVWLEAYLTNGKVHKSDVIEIKTQPGPYAEPNELIEKSESKDYYGSMVAAIIIAVLAILTLIIIVLLYLKRTITYKAIISGKSKQSSHSSKSDTLRSTAISMNDSNFEMNGVKSN